MKDLEAERRTVLRDFMVKANVAIGDSWSKLRTLCGPACDSAHAVDSSRGAVDREVASLAAAGVAEKVSVLFVCVFYWPGLCPENGEKRFITLDKPRFDRCSSARVCFSKLPPQECPLVPPSVVAQGRKASVPLSAGGIRHTCRPW